MNQEPIISGECARELWRKARGMVEAGNCNFSDWEFPDDPDKLWFSGVTFAQRASFDNAVFAHAIFKKAVFKETADFGGMTVQRYADFDNVKFERDAYFERSEFCGEAVFMWTQFQQFAVFRAARFQGEVYFEHAVFNGSVDFNAAIAERPVSLPAAHLVDDVDGIVSAFRLAKMAAHSVGEYDREAAFHFLERRAENHARRRTAKSRCGYAVACLELFFGEWLLGYGERVRGVLIAMLFVVVGFSLVYFACGWQMTTNCAATETIHSYPDSLYFSLMAFTAFGYNLPEYENLRWLPGIEALCGIILPALFVVNMARKFTR